MALKKLKQIFQWVKSNYHTNRIVWKYTSSHKENILSLKIQQNVKVSTFSSSVFMLTSFLLLLKKKKKKGNHFFVILMFNVLCKSYFSRKTFIFLVGQKMIFPWWIFFLFLSITNVDHQHKNKCFTVMWNLKTSYT